MSSVQSLTQSQLLAVAVLFKALREKIVGDNYHDVRLDIRSEKHLGNLAMMKLDGSLIDSTGRVWCYDGDFMINKGELLGGQRLVLRPEQASREEMPSWWKVGTCKINYSYALGPQNQSAHFRFERASDLSIELSEFRTSA